MARVSPRMTGRGPWTFDGQSGDIVTIEQWVIVRVSVSNVALNQNGYDEAVYPQASMAACACWALETGWGRAEWNFNVGNIHANGWPGDSAVLSNGEEIRVYPSVEAGIADWWRLVVEAPRYESAEAAFLTDHGTDWEYLLGWSELRRAGYGGSGTNAREAWQIYNRVRSSLGFQALPEAQFAAFSARWWMPGSTTAPTPAAPAPGTTRTVFETRSSSGNNSNNGIGLALGALGVGIAIVEAMKD